MTLARNLKEILELLKGGVSLSEVVMPKTRPEKAKQLALFGDL
ncbi:MAG: hypothetical protein KatS3mg110_0481 [Pirellulaceae bacterium]|nr:MAG: hypothetical protein KatS3mg110_0471 [Pirellulaceae bacterium]GIW92440.1 MAG: hypothetical protein KatS3mg110_0481 [Pirellulaceae bacterium]